MSGGPRTCPDCGELTEVRREPGEPLFSDESGTEVCPNCRWSPGLA